MSTSPTPFQVMNVDEVLIEPMERRDWAAVSEIYREGIATGHATFTNSPPDSIEDFLHQTVTAGNLVARTRSGTVLGWTRLTLVSSRCVYAGVAEVSLYVAATMRGKGIGGTLLREMIRRSEAADVWTLQAGIFPENTASLALHARHGFREVGRRERMGKMTAGPQAGHWRDVLLLERRSTVAGVV